MPDAPTSSLTVLGGPLNGTRVTLDPAAGELLVGSDPNCRLRLDLAGISPVHARIAWEPGAVVVHDTESTSGVYVNGQRVTPQAPIKDNDNLWLGPPGEPGSVLILCRIVAPRTGVAPATKTAAPPAAAPIAEPMIEVTPEPASHLSDDFFVEPSSAEPSAEPTAVGDDFVMDVPDTTPAPAPAPGPSFEEFIVDEGGGVSGFAVDAAVPTAAVTETPRTTEVIGEDAFLVEETSAPAADLPAAAPPVDDAFFVDEPMAPAPPPATPAPLEPAPPPPKLTPAPPKPPPPPAGPPASPTAAAAPPAAAPPAPAPEPRAEPPRPRAAPVPRAAPRKHDTGAPEMAPGRERVPPVVGAARAAPPKPQRKAAPSAAPRYAALGILGLLLLAGVGLFLTRITGAPKLVSVAPARVHAGQAVTLTGSHFAGDAAGNSVLFGDRPGRVLAASPTQLQVEVPEIAGPAGRDSPIKVVVRTAGRDTAPLEVALYQAPRIHGLSPDVAMPGDEVALAGTGWGPGAHVRFGPLEAEVIDIQPTAIKVRVPALQGGPGTAAQVVVAMGEDASNPAPFVVGHLPLVLGIEPATAGPGDVVTLTGRGFKLQSTDNVVRIGGVHALLLSSSGGELKVVVPRLPATEGEVPVEVRVRGLESPGQAVLKVPRAVELVDFHFVAEPLDDAEGHDHALLATDLGPAFVLSAAGGRTAAQRGLDAQRRLNAAAVPLKASRDADLEARGIETSPTIGLLGKPEAVLEIAEEDAAAYNEDWTKLAGKGGPVTRARLGLWWGAVARDLVLLLVRSEKPHFAADLAPEGRVLGDVFQAARKATGFGVPARVVAEARPPVRDALRILALRVPAAVAGPAGAAAAAQAPVRLDGAWTGWQMEAGLRRYVTVVFRGNGGTLTLEGGVAVSVPLLSVEQQKGSVRFSLLFRGGTRYYVCHLEGEKLAGTIFSDPAGKSEIGPFELTPGQ